MKRWAINALLLLLLVDAASKPTGPRYGCRIDQMQDSGFWIVLVWVEHDGQRVIHKLSQWEPEDRSKAMKDCDRWMKRQEKAAAEARKRK